MVRLDVNGPVPLYYQLELSLREKIESGAWKPATFLPSESELVEQYGVSRTTVRNALDRLEEDGLIVRRQGTRTQVAPTLSFPSKIGPDSPIFRGFEDEMRRLAMSPTATLLEATTGIVPASVAALLKLEENEPAVRIRRLGSEKNQPLWLESRYFPVDIGGAILRVDPVSDSILSLLQRKLKLQIAQVEAQLQAVTATAKQAELLAVPEGVPLLRHRSLTVTTDRRPVQTVEVFLRADRYTLVLYATPRSAADSGARGLVLTGGGYVVDRE